MDSLKAVPSPKIDIELNLSRRSLPLTHSPSRGSDFSKAKSSLCGRCASLNSRFLLQEEDVRERLQSYSKFVVVRHPLERLLSAYRNKFASTSADAKMFKKYYAVRMMRFSRNGSADVPESGEGMTFAEFLAFLGSAPSPASFQEHWGLYVNLCHPCAIAYDFIGRYESLEEDSNRILREIGAPSWLSFPPFEPSKTAQNLRRALQNVSEAARTRLVLRYEPDFLLFGYNETFPSVEWRNRTQKLSASLVATL